MRQTKNYRIDYAKVQGWIDTAITTATSKAEARRKAQANYIFGIKNIIEIPPTDAEALGKYQSIKVIA